jgi:hypothetical protein
MSDSAYAAVIEFDGNVSCRLLADGIAPLADQHAWTPGPANGPARTNDRVHVVVDDAVLEHTHPPAVSELALDEQADL